MNKDLVAIFEYLEREKGIKREIVIEAIEDSLLAAAKKSVKGVSNNIQVQIHPKTGDIEVVTQKKIVEDVADADTEISLDDAKELEENSQLGQWLEILVTPRDFGRIAARTAKQVIHQKLKSAERDVIYEEYRHRKGTIISGSVKRFIRDRTMIIDLAKVEAILPDRFYPKTEHYHVGEKVQALLWEVRDTDIGGAEVVLSRSHPEFVVELFKQEVPEIHDGIVQIEKIVREPGYRTKMAVTSSDPKVDPVGTCVGVRGARIKNIIRELNNEKIDVTTYTPDHILLLEQALSPIEIRKIRETEDTVFIVVADEDYPAVIGRKGMNARLLSRLIDFELDVQKLSEYQKLVTVQMAELADQDDPSLDEPLKLESLSSLILEALASAGFDTVRKVAQCTPVDLMQKVPGLNYFELADKILEQLRKKKV